MVVRWRAGFGQIDIVSPKAGATPVFSTGS
jgi:hypothetical protein